MIQIKNDKHVKNVSQGKLNYVLFLCLVHIYFFLSTQKLHFNSQFQREFLKTTLNLTIKHFFKEFSILRLN